MKYKEPNKKKFQQRDLTLPHTYIISVKTVHHCQLRFIKAGTGKQEGEEEEENKITSMLFI